MINMKLKKKLKKAWAWINETREIDKKKMIEEDVPLYFNEDEII